MARLAVDLVLILVSARLLGRLAARLGQPSVLGELAAGLLLALLVPGFDAGRPLLNFLAEAGVLLLLFETGLHSDFDRLLRAGPRSAAVAAVGVAVPFALGYALMAALGKPGAERVFVGAALTATSVGITARVLSDLGKLGAPEAQIVLGAAVIDDVIGVLILSALRGGADSGSSMGTAMIVGSFGAGLLLSRARGKARIERAAVPLTALLAPVFFASVGAKIDPGALGGASLGTAALLCAAAVAGKLAAGLAAGRGVNRWAVGIGMIPRGEVGLIFARVGLAAGVVEPSLYAATVAMVIVTTFLAPPLLKRSLS